jgi:predicted PurR-regulated permease PerM
MVLLTGALWVARSVLIPIVLAILLTFILTPLVVALQRRGLSRTAAVTLVTVLLLVVLLGGLAALSKQLHDLAAELPTHQGNIARKLKELQGEGPGVVERLTRMVEEISAEVRAEDGEQQRVQNVRVVESKATGLSLVPLLAGPLLNLLGSASLVIALAVSMLFKREDLRNRLIRLIGQGSLTSTTRAFDEGAHRISNYLVVQVVLNAAFGFLFGLGLAVVGVPYALLWGFLAGVLRFIPYIGSWLGGAFPLLISVAVSDGWIQPMLVVAFLVLLNFLANNIVEPMLVSRTTGVSPIALVVAAAFWTWLWGLTGLVLATPMTVCLAVIGKYVPQLAFLDVLLGTEPALDPRYGYYQRLLARDEAEAAELVETFLQEHTPEELCDEVLIPALVRVREDFNRDDLSQEDVGAILEATREVLDGQGIGEPTDGAGTADGAVAGDVRPVVKILGCPARDAVDELALHLFQLLLGPAYPIEVLSTRLVTAEIAEWVKQEQVRVVCIAAVPPGGLTRARYLCKRLRPQFPDLILVVGAWGLTGEEAARQKQVEQLRAAGANHVATTMQASRDQLAPVLQALSHHVPEVVAEPTSSASG